jgi:hypothetical protein
MEVNNIIIADYRPNISAGYDVCTTSTRFRTAAVYIQKPQRAAQAHGNLLTREVQMDNKKYLMELEDLAELRITGYSVGAGRIHFQFMDCIKVSGPTSSPRILRKGAQHFGK